MLPVHTVWLPMFPRAAERRALPEVAEEFEGAPLRQYWDDARTVGRDFEAHVIPEFDGEVAWDVWVLFDEGATWETAPEHVVGWGYTVESTREELFDRLEAIAGR